MKIFNTPRDVLNYLTNKAKEGETILLDEKATAIHPRRKRHYRKRTTDEEVTIKLKEIIKMIAEKERKTK